MPDYSPPVLIPTADSIQFMILRCAICLHKPPGDRDITQATPAVTVMDGTAVCEEHVEWLALKDSIEEALLDERSNRK